MTNLSSLTDAELATVARRLSDTALARLIRGARPRLAKVQLSGAERLARIGGAGFTAAFAEIATGHHTTLEVVLGTRGTVNVVAARHAMWRLARDRGLSFHAIAALFDVDHSSVLLALMPEKRKAARNTRRKLAQIATDDRRERRSA